MDLAGTGRFVCALVSFIVGEPVVGLVVVVIDIHYKLEASHDGR